MNWDQKKVVGEDISDNRTTACFEGWYFYMMVLLMYLRCFKTFQYNLRVTQSPRCEKLAR
jgi:hypothetical protein